MDRFTWGIAVGVLALVLVGVGVAVAVRGRTPPPDLTTPSGVVLAYAEALQRGDAETAWDLLSTSAQGSTTRDQFLRRASGLREPEERVRLATENEQVQGDTARVELVRIFPAGGGPFSFGASPPAVRNTVRLVRENGAWRISGPPDPYLLSPP